MIFSDSKSNPTFQKLNTTIKGLVFWIFKKHLQINLKKKTINSLTKKGAKERKRQINIKKPEWSINLWKDHQPYKMGNIQWIGETFQMQIIAGISKDVGKQRFLVYCLWECNLVHFYNFGKQFANICKTENIHILWPINSISRYTRDMNIGT